MKTRIISTLVVLVGGHFLDNALFHPVETLVKNNVAVATVNGGDAAWVAQQAVHSGSSIGHTLFVVAAAVAVVAIWWAPVKALFSSTEDTNS